jgi:hypothetical protein
VTKLCCVCLFTNVLENLAVSIFNAKWSNSPDISNQGRESVGNLYALIIGCRLIWKPIVIQVPRVLICFPIGHTSSLSLEFPVTSWTGTVCIHTYWNQTMFIHITLKMEGTTFFKVSANYLTTAWYHHLRMATGFYYQVHELKVSIFSSPSSAWSLMIYFWCCRCTSINIAAGLQPSASRKLRIMTLEGQSNVFLCLFYIYIYIYI